MTPVDEIFRYQRFDTSDIRTAVSDLLLGMDEFELHDLRLQIRDVDREYDVLVGELKSIFSVLGQTDDSNITILDFTKEQAALIEERRRIAHIVESYSTKRDESARSTIDDKSNALLEELRIVNESISEKSEALSALEIDHGDSESFIQTLSERIEAIDASQGMADFIGAVSFTTCPACLGKIDKSGIDGACHLCKTPFLESMRWSGHLKMREELVFQMRESKKLIGQKAAAIVQLKRALDSLQSRSKNLASQIAEFNRRVDPVDAEIANQLKRIGYLDRTIEDLAGKAELAKVVGEKIAKRDQLASLLAGLRDRLKLFEVSGKTRRDTVAAEIENRCLEALHKDLPMEESFVKAESVIFDFGKNQLRVNGRSRFSASSSTYLKNAFLFSLFELSLSDELVRWPRFILLDNIEDKGMQPRRSANFQEYVVDRLSKVDVEHQLIMTTSMISEKFEDSNYCVGPHYSEKQKTLSFVKGH
jgi:hypothetical protein